MIPYHRSSTKHVKKTIRNTYRYNVSYVLRIIQSLESNPNYFVILEGWATTVTTIYCGINLFHVLRTALKDGC